MPKIYVFTGAGISAESGIKTFRDADGLWENFSIDEVCNFATWLQNYHPVHDFYNARRQDLAGVEPNAAHKFIKELQDLMGVDNVINITTNVDDLLERAGVKNVIHLHGNLTEIRNVVTGDIKDIGYTSYDKTDFDVKPNVVFFGEMAPEYQTMHNIANHQMTTDDLVIFIGMSYQVVPAWMCMPLTGHIKTVNVNPDVTTNVEYPFDAMINLPATQSIDDLRSIIAKWAATQS